MKHEQARGSSQLKSIRDSTAGNALATKNKQPIQSKKVESVKRINLSNTDLSSFDFNQLFSYELESMPMMRSLESITFGFNKVTDWEDLKDLESLDLSKNPIVETNKFTELSVALFDNLKELNREALSEELLKTAEKYKGKIAQAVRYGMMIPKDENLEDINNLLAYTEEWLLSFYRDISKTTPFHLLSYTFDPIQPVQDIDCRFFSVFYVNTRDIISLKAEGMGLLTFNNSNGEWTNMVFDGSSMCINIEHYKGI
ncbi:hypothetical protein C9374_000130 [Naegleria lovaniensis]|uniref:Uncharacterized protein n=1 Tax=Naegleria lovaniensis TaxID=51637 RepID=A0AA88KPK2_NAELO|nr:uncharacterized protein C9374_000130 [Naegleria lovaniensis]KAG2388691.1 hypothetical protein C9374_000130 [Naegleria lovaniensis]